MVPLWPLTYGSATEQIRLEFVVFHLPGWYSSLSELFHGQVEPIIVQGGVPFCL